MTKTFFSCLFFGLIISLLFGVNLVEAVSSPEVVVRDNGYQAKFVSQSVPDPIEIEAGKNKTVIINFKNIGSKVWDSASTRYISAYTMEPRNRQSVFRGSNWISGGQTGKISGTIKSGEVGSLSIDLKAPDKIGEYVEKFYLAVENYSWVEGGYFFLKIKVIPAKEVVKVVENNNNDYQAKQVMINKKSFIATGGQVLKLIIGFENQGEKDWNKYSFVANSSEWADTSWHSATEIISGSELVSPGKFLRQTFLFRAPVKKGVYTAQFDLVVDDDKLKQSFSLPIEVTADAPNNYQAPVFGTGEVAEKPVRLSYEPRVRVGIVAPETNFIQFRSYEDDYNVFDGTKLVGLLPVKTFTVIKFADNKYSLKGGDLDFVANDFIRLEPTTNPHAVFHIPNLNTRTAKWVDPNKMFNKYRGALEYRQGEVDKKLYIVNDILIEDYVKGMAETSRTAPIEFVKANLVAARNYAFFNKNKYPFFDVLGNTYDQLYLGFEGEEVLPNVVAGAEATRGMMVTYNNEVVVTPYFGNSNGWTKSYSSVWGGAFKPWLVPVLANYDSGRRQLGHGVGMSQRDAAYRADKEGLNFIELLKYYYTGVEVEKIFN